ncbi:hypothetical protein MRX96_022744 [Rhipicephalus microplus]
MPLGKAFFSSRARHQSVAVAAQQRNLRSLVFLSCRDRLPRPTENGTQSDIPTFRSHYAAARLPPQRPIATMRRRFECKGVCAAAVSPRVSTRATKTSRQNFTVGPEVPRLAHLRYSRPER